MIHPKLIGITVGGLGMAMAVIAAVESPVGGSLPGEINAREIEFQKRQIELEADRHHFTLSTLNRTPEERRELFVAWETANASLLKEQAALSDELDALYDKHGIQAEDFVSWSASREASTGAETDSPSGRILALDRQLAEIRQTYADDPEQLRDRLHAWFEVNGRALEAAQQEERSQQLANSPQTPEAPLPEKIAVIPHPESPPMLRKFFELGNTLQDLADADPSPLTSGGATSAEMEAWRERVHTSTQPVVEELEKLNRQLSDEGNRQVAHENQYEIGKK